tara:strand:- start:391 stop:603 length:213 start_codon:yes stop_codon:yes gene_type:complete
MRNETKNRGEIKMTIYQTEVETHDGNIKTLNINSDSLIELSGSLYVKRLDVLDKWENNNNNINNIGGQYD